MTRTCYRVYLDDDINEWQFEHKKKSVALNWMVRFLLQEEKSGYSYKATLRKVTIKNVCTKRNY